MKNKTVKALQNLYASLGGALSDVLNITNIPDMIDSISGFVGIKDTGVQAEKGSATLFGTKVSAMQSNVVVADGSVTGTLKFIENGIAGSGPLAGSGNFLALKFIDENNSDSIKVGLVPSASNMNLVELDDDMNAVFKISGEINGVQQSLKVVTTLNGVSKIQTFDLTGLVLEES